MEVSADSFGTISKWLSFLFRNIYASSSAPHPYLLNTLNTPILLSLNLGGVTETQHVLIIMINVHIFLSKMFSCWLNGCV